MRTSHVLRQRRVCDAGLQTAVRQQPPSNSVPPTTTRRPRAPSAPPTSTKHHAASRRRQNRPGPLALSFFLHPSLAPLQPMGRRLSERSCCGRGLDWLAAGREGPWREIFPLSLPGAQGLTTFGYSSSLRGPGRRPRDFLRLLRRERILAGQACSRDLPRGAAHPL